MDKKTKSAPIYRTSKQTVNGLGTAPAAHSHAAAKKPRTTMIKSQSAIRKKIGRFYKAIKLVASGKSLSQATKKARIARVTFQKINSKHEVLVKNTTTGRYQIKTAPTFDIPVKEGTLYKRVPVDRVNASVVSRFWIDYYRGLKSGDLKALRPYRGKIVYDILGRKYHLLASVAELKSMLDQMTDAEAVDFIENLYRPARYAN